MRWVPLLAAVLSLSALPSAASAACMVPTWNEPGKVGAVYDLASPECIAATDLIMDVSRIRSAAGFNQDTLKYFIDPGEDVNAYYVSGRIALNAGYLRSNLAREARLATIAHEVGHAVQDKMGQFDWAEEPRRAFLAAHKTGDPEFEKSPQFAEYHARGRKLESQADLIGQELLVRAGYDADLFRRGRENRWGCDNNDLYAAVDDTHPGNARRYVNAAMARGAKSNDRARDEARRIASSLGQAPYDPGLNAPSPRRGPYVPSATVADFDDHGRLKPGRQIAASLAIPVPSDDDNPVKRHAQYIAGSTVDFWIVSPFRKAVDRVAELRPVQAQVLAACGTPQAAKFAEEYGTMAWVRRVAADAAETLVKRKDRGGKLVSGAVPG